MAIFRSPCCEVVLYIFGMLSLGVGCGFLISSIDPSPLPDFTWWYLLLAGISLVIVGVSVLSVVIAMPVYPEALTITRQSANETSCSAADLLSDSHSQSFIDSPAMQVRNPAFISDEDFHIVQQCMMTKTPTWSGNSVFYYKETFV